MNTTPALALQGSPLTQLRRLTVTFDESEVVISGHVQTYYLKQLAQETVRPTLGDRRLCNRVEVTPPSV